MARSMDQNVFRGWIWRVLWTKMYLGDEYGAFYGPKFKHKTHEIGEDM